MISNVYRIEGGKTVVSMKTKHSILTKVKEFIEPTLYIIYYVRYLSNV